MADRENGGYLGVLFGRLMAPSVNGFSAGGKATRTSEVPHIVERISPSAVELTDRQLEVERVKKEIDKMVEAIIAGHGMLVLDGTIPPSADPVRLDIERYAVAISNATCRTGMSVSPSVVKLLYRQAFPTREARRKR